MVMELPNIIYRGEIKKFYRRVIRAFIYPFILYSLMLTLPFLWEKFRTTPIATFWIIINVLFMAVSFYSSYTWSKNYLYMVAYKDKAFHLIYYYKDECRSVEIKEELIGTELKWMGGRQKVLRLSIFDGNNKIADFYSRSNNVGYLDLENVAYNINELVKKE